MKNGLLFLSLSLAVNLLSNRTLLAESALFSDFKEAKLKLEYFRHWDRYSLITGKDSNGFKIQTIEGQINRHYYDIPKSYSEETILINYMKAIEAIGGEVLYVCKGENECGKAKVINKTVRPLKSIAKSNPHLLVAKLQRDNKEIYLSLYIHSREKLNNLQLDIIEPKQQPQDLVKLNLKSLDSKKTKIKFKPLNINYDVKDSSDHPLMSRLPGSIISKYKTFGYQTNQLVNTINKNDFAKLKVNGKTTIIGYNMPREYSEIEVIENYKSALNTAGFKTVFDCENTACGKSRKLAKALDSLVSINADKHQYYLLSRLERPKGNVWVSIFVTGYINGLKTNLHIVEESSLNNQRLNVDVDSIRQAINRKGHIALEGLLFKYDSDNLLEDSLPVLTQVAEYLQSETSQNFYVVGHTDDKGERSYNTALSHRRAKKIIELLVKNFSINKSRLAFEGAGEYVPIASNGNEQGRQLNRRVELVLRSDNK